MKQIVSLVRVTGKENERRKKFLGARKRFSTLRFSTNSSYHVISSQIFGIVSYA